MLSIRRHGALLLAAAGFLLFTFFASYHLSESPGIWFDEGMFTQTALNLERYGIQSIQTAPGQLISAGTVTGGFTFIAPIALLYKLFGPGVLQGRLVMLGFMLLFAAAAYAFIRKLFGPWCAAWTVLLLSSFAMLYGNGKPVLGEVPGFFFLMLALLALLWLERSSYRSLGAYATLGLFAGFCIVTKPIFVLLLPAIALAWLFRFREARLKVAGVALGAVAFLAPLLVWLFMQFRASDSVGTILSFYANPYQVADLKALLISNALHFFTDASALYTLVLIGAWALAALIRRRAREKVSVAEATAFLFAVCVVLASLRLPGWNRYLFPATTVALLFFPFSVVVVYGWISEKLPRVLRASWIPYAFLTLMILFQFYQVGFSSYVASYYHSNRVEAVQSLTHDIPDGQSVFVYNVPEVVILLGDHPYYQYLLPDSTQQFGQDQFPRLVSGSVDYVLMGTSDYTATDPLFASYTPIAHGNRYTLLKKS